MLFRMIYGKRLLSDASRCQSSYLPDRGKRNLLPIAARMEARLKVSLRRSARTGLWETSNYQQVIWIKIPRPVIFKWHSKDNAHSRILHIFIGGIWNSIYFKGKGVPVLKIIFKENPQQMEGHYRILIIHMCFRKINTVAVWRGQTFKETTFGLEISQKTSEIIHDTAF